MARALVAALVVTSLLAGCGTAPLAAPRASSSTNFYTGLGVGPNGTLTRGRSDVFTDAEFTRADRDRSGALSRAEIDGFFSEQPETGLGELPIDPSMLVGIGITGGVLAGYLAFAGTKISSQVLHPDQAGAPASAPAEAPLMAGDVKLAYTYAPACTESDRAIVLLHPLGSAKPVMNEYGAFLRNQFHTVAVDFRQHGASEGKQTTGGQAEARDVLAAVAFLKSKGIQRIGVLGLGMGGVAGLNAAALGPDVRAVVAEGAYGSLADDFYLRAQRRHYPLANLVARAAVAIMAFRTGTQAGAGDARSQVGKLSAATLFIQGTADNTVLATSAQSLFEAATGKKSLWAVQGAGPGLAHRTVPADYEARVLAFFTENL